jgi:long-chain acyl-CoA synthetase
MKLAEAKGIKGTFEELCGQKAIRFLVLSEMNAVGRKEGLNGFELAKNVYLETKGFLARGILTNTMKLIRFEARQVYKE